MSLRNVGRQVQTSCPPPAADFGASRAESARDAVKPGESALARISNKNLIRSIVLTTAMRRECIMRPSLKFLEMVTKAKSMWLNADRNPALNRLLRWTIYNHFCTGSTKGQVARPMAEVKGLAYQGIILGHAKGVILNPKAEEVCAGDHKYGPACYRMVEEWKQSNLDTLCMLQPGDFLSVK
ncbi:hypothetical protein ACKLNR_007292 [Fusarium oxysporum f. sp. zingiberi]